MAEPRDDIDPKDVTTLRESLGDTARDVYDRAFDDLWQVFTQECGRDWTPNAAREWGRIFGKTIGAAISRGDIREWNAQDKAYVYPHVQGIAARVCGDCDADEITADALQKAADPWIKSANARAKQALARLARKMEETTAEQDTNDLRAFFTIYCDNYS